MGFFVKILIAALVIAVMLPFTFLKGKDGRPLMSIDDLKGPDLSLPKIPSGISPPDSATGSAGNDLIYKWKDAEGVTQFTSSPPPAGVEYTSKGYDPNMNLIQSVKVKPEPEAEPEAEPQSKKEKTSSIGNPYSPEKVEKLFDDAKNIEKLLNDRMKQQEAALGQ